MGNRNKHGFYGVPFVGHESDDELAKLDHAALNIRDDSGWEPVPEGEESLDDHVDVDDLSRWRRVSRG